MPFQACLPQRMTALHRLHSCLDRRDRHPGRRWPSLLTSTRASSFSASIRRRMPTHLDPGAACGDEKRTVEFQCQHCRASDGRLTFDQFSVGSPAKVLRPFVAARMEEPDTLIRLVVEGRRPTSGSLFFRCTPRRAAQPQILAHGAATE